MPLRDNQKTRRPRLAAPPRTVAALSLAAVLLGAACTQDDPRFPAYFRYAVDVKVDGVPVTIERVVKCTGTRSWNTSANPGGWTHHSYVNPPAIGQVVRGSDAAVYVRVPSACEWAAEFQGRHSREPPLQPGDVVPVLWTNNWRRLEQIEYYTTPTSLSGKDSHVVFVGLQPITRTGRRAFEASEARAAHESPDLRALVNVEAKGSSAGIAPPGWVTTLSPPVGTRGTIGCHGVLSLKREDWGSWPELKRWIESLPDDGKFYDVRSALNDTATSLLRESAFSAFPKILSYPFVNKGLDPEQYAKAIEMLSSLHPIFPSPDGAYIDNTKSGIAGCSYDIWHYPSSYASSIRKNGDRLKYEKEIKIYSDAKFSTPIVNPNRNEINLIIPMGGSYPRSNEAVTMRTVNDD